MPTTLAPACRPTLRFRGSNRDRFSGSSWPTVTPISLAAGCESMLGGLGGFLLPPLFAYATGWTGLPSATFFVLFLLTAVCAAWMHRTVVHMLQTEAPELADHFESPRAQEASAR